MHFSIEINASRAHVWRILWDDATYRQWTAVFHEGSHAESDWQEGSPILFLGPDGGGMNSRIARNIPGQYMSFEHLGEIHGGVADTRILDANGGVAPQENYTLTDSDTGTLLEVSFDDPGPDMEAYFAETFPVALQKVQELAETIPAQVVTVNATVAGSLAKIWEYWTLPEHITQWNAASPDWHCPVATNDLRTGGKFSSTMAARDGRMAFDFEGIYREVVPQQKIVYMLADGRRVSVEFVATNGGVQVTEVFDPEQMNPVELQQQGWQAILNHFKTYTESH